MRLERLDGLRIAILGYGREGAAAAAVLRARGLEPLVWAESGPVPGELPSRSGPFDQGLLAFDVLIRSPGIPVLHPALQRFRASGRPVVNPSSIWLAERPDVQVVAVTGSKGKSTTASLLAHVLGAAGRRVLLAGNIGVPVLEHLDSDVDIAVLELSSYQLADLEGRLHLGLMTRLFPEHGDWHGGVSHYVASKLRMVGLLGGNELLVNARDPVLLQATDRAPARVLANRPPLVHREENCLMQGGDCLLRSSQWPLQGQHNLDNAALVVEAALRLGMDASDVAIALRSFQPLPHRLEIVACEGARQWINDSIATTPHATLAALEALQDRAVVLIAGGYVRPAEWSVVVEHCRTRPLAGLVLLPDSGQRIAEAFLQAGGDGAGCIRRAVGMDEAVATAAALAGGRASILLSPGAASFPQYRDFEDRGEQFRRAVAAYRERSTA